MNNANNDLSNNVHGSNNLGWFDWPAMIIFASLMLVVFAQFITRYVFNDSWAWTEEVSRYLLMALVFAGSISVVIRSEHIALEVIKRRISVENAQIMSLFSKLVSISYYIFFAIAILLLSAETTQNLVSVTFPKSIVYIFIGVCLVAVIVIKLIQLFSAQARSEFKSHD